jgi:hypothetical protein
MPALNPVPAYQWVATRLARWLAQQIACCFTRSYHSSAACHFFSLVRGFPFLSAHRRLAIRVAARFARSSHLSAAFHTSHSSFRSFFAAVGGLPYGSLLGSFILSTRRWVTVRLARHLACPLACQQLACQLARQLAFCLARRLLLDV